MTRLLRLRRLALTAAALGVVASLAVACGAVRTETPVAAVAVQGAVAVAEAAPPVAAPTPVAPAKLVAWGPAPGLAVGAAAAPAISGESAILIDEASGISLFEKDPHTRVPPASLTKIMTALIALERGHLDDRVEISVDSRRMRGSTVMGLVPGERLTLEDLLYGMMLPSGNDAALAISEHISGSTDAFVALMNQRAAELGLINTHFANPHGLDNAAHYSSAFDLAVLTRVAMQRQDFRTIANTKYHVVTGTMATYDLGTLNPLYGRIAGVDGVKTGYTRTARQTLVGSVTRDGHRVLVVVLRSPDRAYDGTVLLNWAFDAYQWRPAPSTVAAPDPSAVPGT
jgi:D-alanyl-D-alanine carboxypeptidase (penicillin-binding protein 5/6)